MSGRSLALGTFFCLVSARAGAATPAEPWAIRLELGAALPTEHVHPTGGAGVSLPGYLGLTVERRIVSRFSVAATGGVDLLVGWVGSAMARVSLLETPNASISLGGGPMLVDDVGVGWAAAASADFLAEACPNGHVCLSFGLNEAVVLNHGGTPGCGVDTCNAYFARGDQIFTLRFGIGYRF